MQAASRDDLVHRPWILMPLALSFACGPLLLAGCGGDEPATGGDALAGGDALLAGDADAPACALPPRAFWRWDLTAMPPADIQVQASCRGQGQRVALYVEDDIWPDTMTPDMVGAVLASWEQAVPADDSAGIFDLVTGLYAPPSDVDGNSLVLLLYGELGCFQSTCFDGHFRVQDLDPGARSNLAELLILDGARPAGDGPGGDYMLGVGAHEFQHLLHAVADYNEQAWVNEALSELAMVVCGYDDPDWVADFCDQPTQQLVTSDGREVHYGAVLLFALYVYERYGVDFVRGWFSNPLDGVAALDDQLTDTNSAELFADWAVALLLDDPALAGGLYGLAGYDVPALTTRSGLVTGATDSLTCYPWAARFVTLELPGALGGVLTLELTRPAGANLPARLVTSGGGAAQVSALDAGTDQFVQAVPAGHDRADLVLFTAEGVNRIVSYRASFVSN